MNGISEIGFIALTADGWIMICDDVIHDVDTDPADDTLKAIHIKHILHDLELKEIFFSLKEGHQAKRVNGQWVMSKFIEVS